MAPQARVPTAQQVDEIAQWMSKEQLEKYAKGEFGVYGGRGLPEGSTHGPLTLYRPDKSKFELPEGLTEFERVAKSYPQVNFFYAYIEEAHPNDGWTIFNATGDHIEPDETYQDIPPPKTLDERIALAKQWHEKMGLSVELLIDDVDDATNIAFAGRPERLYIIDGTTVLFQGGEGPHDYSVPKMAEALAKLVLDKV
ncbi:hypothetical protein CTAYLR_009263 [Chrysophaeum taylorii]|uniref:Iodothyronine deiodinase n=1 Tax=Chrysophaeum taylorii TaxID=2483200 RepID=A0AAD7U7Y4_9STRA|nr:hypothetical protein CTAYLR_009263 [Chrysophaeum taylorii]